MLVSTFIGTTFGSLQRLRPGAEGSMVAARQMQPSRRGPGSILSSPGASQAPQLVPWPGQLHLPGQAQDRCAQMHTTHTRGEKPGKNGKGFGIILMLL